MSVSHDFNRHRLSVADYHKMGQAGILSGDDRVELIEGELVDMAPIGSEHAGIVNLLNRLLTEILGERAIIGVQNPIVLGDHSEPQPDILVLHPRKDFYRDSHPTSRDVFLLIEVSDTTANQDRNIKIALYAQHDIPEVWLIDIPNRSVELYRKPHSSTRTYQHIEILRDGTASCTQISELKIDLNRLF